MKKSLVVLFCLLFLLLSLSSAQERYNFLAVDGEILADSSGPFYFIAQGDNQNAFALASEFALGLGAELRFDAAKQLLVFRRGNTTVSLAATADIVTGLEKRPGVLNANGRNIDSPMAILINNTSYVPISPLVKAFGDESEWDAQNRVVMVYTNPQTYPTQISPPRIALHDDYTRVALDLPSGSNYDIAAAENSMVIGLPGMQASEFGYDQQDPNISGVSFEERGGQLTLVINTQHPLSADGQGYRLGFLAASPERPNDVLYIDFGPKLSGDSVRALDTPLPPQVAAVRLPAGLKPTVVIDAGHGGNDGGAQGFVGEDEVALAIALKIRDLLESQGMDVILTRDDDVFLTLAERARFATTERNVFVSIHANSAPDRKANGIETWVFGQSLNDSQIDIAITENGGGAIGEELTRQAQEVANSIAGDILREDQLRFSLNLAEHVQEQLVGATGARDRGVRQNVFYVIKNARIPAILVEVGFVSNPEEGEKLGTAAYQEKLATALANGISNFFDSGGALARR